MKKQNLMFIAIVTAALMGCAQPKSKTPKASEGPAIPPGATIIDPNSGPWTPSGSGPGTGPGADWDQGGSATLDIVSVSRLSEYATEARNNPTNIRINLNLSKIGTDTYGGSLAIAYEDSGWGYQGNFTSGTTTTDNRYNVWLEKNGQRGFHAFFEDARGYNQQIEFRGPIGGVIVVIDEFEIEGGDGEGPGDIVGGKVYFKNVDPNTAPTGWYFWPGQYVQRSYCWFISLGPNDCRAWKSGDGVDTYRAIYPDSGYQLLGTFSGLSLQEAFNGDVVF